MKKILPVLITTAVFFVLFASLDFSFASNTAFAEEPKSGGKFAYDRVFTLTADQKVVTENLPAGAYVLTHEGGCIRNYWLGITEQWNGGVVLLESGKEYGTAWGTFRYQPTLEECNAAHEGAKFPITRRFPGSFGFRASGSASWRHTGSVSFRLTFIGEDAPIRVVKKLLNARPVTSTTEKIDSFGKITIAEKLIGGDLLYLSSDPQGENLTAFCGKSDVRDLYTPTAKGECDKIGKIPSSVPVKSVNYFPPWSKEKQASTIIDRNVEEEYNVTLVLIPWSTYSYEEYKKGKRVFPEIYGNSDVFLIIRNPLAGAAVLPPPPSEKQVIIKGFAGISQDLPLSQAQVTLFYNNKELKQFADKDGTYAFKISVREGESIKAQLIVTLADEKWIEVYDELGADKNNNIVVEYETEEFAIDGSQKEIIKDVLITEDLKSNVHEKTFNKDVAAVYHWAWKAAQFAENTLKLKPRPVAIRAFKQLRVGSAAYHEPTAEFGQIELSDGAVKRTGQVKPKGTLYPFALWHEFAHHIEASSPFFGKRGDFDKVGYINHGGYRNPDSKDSVMEGFATFFSSVMADFYKFAEPEKINPPATLNLENNWPVWFNMGGIRGQEDYAVASILWDLYDPVNSLDSDNLDLSLGEMWEVFNTSLTKPATLHDIFKAFSSHPKVKAKDLADRFAASDVYVDANPRNGTLDDAERSSIGKSRWGYDDVDKSGNWDSGELAGNEPDYPRVWDFEREDPPPIENSVISLEAKDEETGNPVENFDVEVRITHPAPYEFYNWEYQLHFKPSSAKVSIPVLVRKDAVAKVTLRADGYEEALVYEIDGKSYVKQMQIPGLERLAKIPIELESKTKKLPDPGLTPDSPLYFLDTAGKNLSLFFTFNPIKKSKKALRYAEERVAEAVAMAQKGNGSAIAKAGLEYQKLLTLANTKAKEVKESGDSKEAEVLAASLAKKTLKHQGLLMLASENMPKEAKDEIKKTMEVASQESEKALEALPQEKQGEFLLKIEETKVEAKEKEVGPTTPIPAGYVQPVTPPPAPAPTPIKKEESQTAVVAKSITITPDKKLEGLKEGNTVTFNAALVMSDGSLRPLTSGVAWAVAGDIGSINASGVFEAKLGDAIAEYGEGMGAVIATYVDVNGNEFVANTPVFKVEAFIPEYPDVGGFLLRAIWSFLSSPF